jgi:hypothetical protein
MGNLPPLLDVICEVRTGRRLSDEKGDWRSDLAVDAPGIGSAVPNVRFQAAPWT